MWSLVQQSAAQTTNGTNTLPSISTAGNLLIATVSSGSNTAISPPANWNTGPNIANGTVSECYIFFYPNNPGGLSSFAFTGPAGAIQVDVAEFTCTNVSSVTTTSDTGTATGGSSTTLAITTGGTAQAEDLVIVSSLQHVGTAAVITWTDPGGFTQFSSLSTTSVNNHQYAAYQLSASVGGAQSVTVTSSLTASATGYTGAVATFSQPATQVSTSVSTPNPILSRTELIGRSESRVIRQPDVVIFN